MGNGTSIGRVRGLGSAHSGSHHWLLQRFTAIGNLLLVLWLRERHRAPELARGHLRQTLAASLWAGVLLVVTNAAIILAGGYDAASTWIIVILYFTCCHSTLIFCGAIGLSKALAGKPFRFPLIGPR